MNSIHAHDAPTPDEVHTARRGLLLYFGIVLLGSVPLLYLIISAGTPIEQQLEYILPLMWTSAIASVVARLGNGEGFEYLSFRLRNRQVVVRVLQAILFSFIVGAIAYGAAWGVGPVEFAAPAGTSDPLLAFAGDLLFAATIVTLASRRLQEVT